MNAISDSTGQPERLTSFRRPRSIDVYPKCMLFCSPSIDSGPDYHLMVAISDSMDQPFRLAS